MEYTDDKLQTFMEHRLALMDYVTRITGCRARAEDVVQDAFLRYAPDEIKDTSVSRVSYLYKIVRNLAIDLVRRSAMETRYLYTNTVTWLEPAGEASPEEHTLQSDQLSRVVEVLSKLSEKERLAIEMYRFSDYTQAEIAERLGVSISTVHRMIRNAMLQISMGLDDDDQD